MSNKVVKLNVKEAGERLGLSKNKVRTLIRLGRLPAENHGVVRPYYLVRLNDLEAYESGSRVVVESAAPTLRKRRKTITTHGWFDEHGNIARPLHD